MPGGGIFVRTPTETKVYFWSPARATKVLFSREAEVQSPVVIGLIKQFISSFQVELSFATRREYLTADSFEKECSTKDRSLWKITQAQPQVRIFHYVSSKASR